MWSEIDRDAQMKDRLQRANNALLPFDSLLHALE
jgi:hypothetical protein